MAENPYRTPEATHVESLEDIGIDKLRLVAICTSLPVVLVLSTLLVVRSKFARIFEEMEAAELPWLTVAFLGLPGTMLIAVGLFFAVYLFVRAIRGEPVRGTILTFLVFLLLIAGLSAFAIYLPLQTVLLDVGP
ncbi:hypothetical protein HAHE_26590 [Haloferula helveola]|uniref:Yip1 domain-containing protein n=1 Tax=Haloferula helveola TaxID=490095 RepID=A0ABM7RHE5_9BACT|nr:hypothetical protein HAHE_26590 [Haloferula helveola]